MAFYRCGSENKSEEPSLGIMGTGDKTGSDKWMPLAEVVVTNADPVSKPVGYWVHKDANGDEEYVPFDYNNPFLIIIQVCCYPITNDSDYIGLRASDKTTIIPISVVKVEGTNHCTYNSSTGFLQIDGSNYTKAGYAKIQIT